MHEKNEFRQCFLVDTVKMHISFIISSITSCWLKSTFIFVWISMQEKDNLFKTAVSWWEMFYYLIFPQQCSQVCFPELSELSPDFRDINPFAIFVPHLWLLQICPIYDIYFPSLFQVWLARWPHHQTPRLYSLMPTSDEIWTNNFSAVHSARRSACGSAWRSDSIQPAWGEGTALQSLPLSGFLVRSSYYKGTDDK